MDALPVIYCTCTSPKEMPGCMSSEIFAKLFKNYVPAVKSHQHSQNIRSPIALLFKDKCSAHQDELSSRSGSVTCLFLPLGMTSLIQPMDQCFLQVMKSQYKRKLLQKVICNQDFDQTQSINKDIVKFHTVKDALYMLSDAWYERSPESICKAYDKLGFEQQ